MNGPSPYKEWAPTYLHLGWSPIPLPLRQKSPIPNGFTGAEGKYVNERQAQMWCRPNSRLTVGNFVYPPGNIALRLPKNVIGVDVDAYDGKAGAATLAEAEAQWGKLPPTWRTGSRRGDPVSGLRLYRLPDDKTELRWPGELPQGKGVELIRWDHRYVIVAPSVHDKKPFNTYFWQDPDGEFVDLSTWPEEEDVPLFAPEDLILMPDEWIEGLTQGQLWVAGETAGGRNTSVGPEGFLPDDEIVAWLNGRDDTEERQSQAGAYANGMCSKMQSTLATHLARLHPTEKDGGGHEAGLAGVWALVGDAQAGHFGIKAALERFKKAFVDAVKSRRASPAEIRKEWMREVRGAVSKSAKEGPPLPQDPCLNIGTGRKPKMSANKQMLFQFDITDPGNAQRLKQHLNGDAVWCGKMGGWQWWDPDRNIWRPDSDNVRMIAEMMDVVQQMQLYAAEDDALKAMARKQSTVGKIEAAIKLARSLGGMSAEPEDFDKDQSVINCANGVIQLTMQGVDFRTSTREDRFTLTTGIRYVPEAHHELWEKFLDRFLPDPAVRGWAQKLAGYSLQGENPSRVLVICKGKTSTGKTTFAEALRTCLGGYANTFSPSLLRGNQDERPRVDVFEALSKRVILAEEMSSAWHLHADQVKRATGNGMWEARALYGKGYVRRVPAFTPWIATNNTPTIEGSDPALLRRIRNIPFLHQVKQAEEDGMYKAKLRAPEVLEAILAWAVAGWDLWLQDEQLSDMPQEVLDQLAEIGGEFNEFSEILAEFAEPAPGARVESSALYEAYKAYCLEHEIEGRARLSPTAFGKRITEAAYDKGVWWNPETQKAVKVRLGLRLRTENDKDVLTGSTLPTGE